MQTPTVFLSALDYTAVLTYLPPWIVWALPTWTVLILCWVGWARMAGDHTVGASNGAYPPHPAAIPAFNSPAILPTFSSPALVGLVSIRSATAGPATTRRPDRLVTLNSRWEGRRTRASLVIRRNSDVIATCECGQRICPRAEDSALYALVMTYASAHNAGPSFTRPANTNNGLAKGASLAAFIMTIVATVALEVLLLAGGELIVRIFNQVAGQTGLGELDPQTLRGALVIAAVVMLLAALIPIGLSTWMWQAARRSSRASMLAPLIIFSLVEVSSLASSLAVIVRGGGWAPYGDLPTAPASPGPVALTNLPWLIVLVLCWIGWATMRDARTLTAPPPGYVMPPSGYYVPPPQPSVGWPYPGATPYAPPGYGQPGYGQPGYPQPGYPQPGRAAPAGGQPGGPGYPGQPPEGPAGSPQVGFGLPSHETPDQPDSQPGFGTPPMPNQPPQ